MAEVALGPSAGQQLSSSCSTKRLRAKDRRCARQDRNLGPSDETLTGRAGIAEVDRSVPWS